MKHYLSRSDLIKLIAVLLLVLVAFIVHSCKKDIKSSTPLDITVEQAKAWYESTYPAPNAGGKLVTQSTGGTHDLSQWIKPDWQHPSGYKRLGKSVIEMPIDPGAKFSSALKIGKNLYNKKYTRSYFLLLNDGNNYDAYIMTIIADSLYVGNDMSKLANNSYRKHDPDFSGMVLYFTPRGAYLEGYAYQHGHLVGPAQTGQQVSNQRVQSVGGNLKTDKMVETCTDYYIVYYTNGVYTSDEYLTTICEETDDGTGDAPTGGSTPPPPPPCPPKTPPPSVESINGGHLIVNFIPPPSDPGDGGMPPPNNNPCPPDTPPTKDTIVVVDPCAKKADVIAMAKNALISGHNVTILTNTTNSNTGNEYGANENLTSLTGNTYVNTPVTTSGGTDTWKITFSWDGTNGYTVGFSHAHPEGYGPSPADVYAIFAPIVNQAVLRNNAANKQTYEQKASVTTLTSAGSYVITITDWKALTALFSSSYMDDTQVEAFEGKYQAAASKYIFDNGTSAATRGDAGTAALLQLFPGMINIYYAPKGTTTYAPLKASSTGTKTLTPIPCP